ncbi:M56 family metallopeptidase [Bacteroidota bacterium]
MNVFNSIITNELTNALALTIIHSLWQGILVGLLCWLILSFVKKENAQTRYWINISGMVSILVLAVFTFNSVYNPVVSALNTGGNSGIDMVLKQNVVAYQANTGFGSSVSFMNNILPYVTILWLMGFLIFFIRFIGGVFYNNKIKNEGLSTVPENWSARLVTLSKKIKNTRAIKLLESSRIIVPTVIGHIKPIILFPVGALAGLPVKQVEAILAHELAHIKRNDYIINIIQSLIEVLFFYHPTIWWLNTKVNMERENCCDDLAMRITGDRLVYAKALSSINEVSEGNLKLAPAFTGNNGKLLSRIQRLYNRSYENVGSNRFSTFAGLMLMVVFVIIFSTSVQSSIGVEKNSVKENDLIENNSQPKITAKVKPLSIYNSNLTKSDFTVQDTIKGKRTIHLDDVEVDGVVYDVYLVMKGKEVIELKIDGKTIAKEDYDKYEKIVKTTIETMDKRMQEVEEKMKMVEKEMEELQESMSIKQEEIQEKVQEMMKDIEKSNIHTEAFDKLQNKMMLHQHELMDQLKHFEKTDLMHIEEDMLKGIKEGNKFIHIEEDMLNRIKEAGHLNNIRELAEMDHIEDILHENIDQHLMQKLKSVDEIRFRADRDINRNMRESQRELEEMILKFQKQFDQGKLSEKELQKNMQKYLKLFQKKNFENQSHALMRIDEIKDFPKIEARRQLERQLQKVKELDHLHEGDLRRQLQKVKELEHLHEGDLRRQLQKVQELEHLHEGELRRNLMNQERLFRGIDREVRSKEAIGQNLIQVLEVTLIHDEIIDDELDSFKLTKRNLYVNGKKQSKKMYKKYKNLYEKISGKELKSEFIIKLDN